MVLVQLTQRSAVRRGNDANKNDCLSSSRGCQSYVGHQASDVEEIMINTLHLHWNFSIPVVILTHATWYGGIHTHTHTFPGRIDLPRAFSTF